MSGLLYATPEYLADVNPDNLDPVVLDQIPKPHGITRDTFVLDLIRECKNFETEANAIKARSSELKEKAASKQRQADKLREWARTYMEQRGLDKCKDTDYTVSLKKEQNTLIVIKETSVPKEFWRAVPTLDKAALKEHYEETSDIPNGCDVKTTRVLMVRG